MKVDIPAQKAQAVKEAKEGKGGCKHVLRQVSIDGAVGAAAVLSEEVRNKVNQEASRKTRTSTWCLSRG